ncbi:MAG: hypothetical protein UZ17_ACD001001242 [Acidobacteria bacterium OLB17]|nr:MAG: hypothetical protein UZ17_ACD001001242 [Acidobacteria bacterium OLB17]
MYKDEELQDNEKLSLRDKINDAWKEIYHQLGRNKENPLDDNDFLRAHWIIYFQYTRKKANSYNSFLLGQKFTPQSVYGTTGLDYYSLHEFEEVREDDETYQEDAEANGQDEAVGSGSKLSPEEIKDYVDSLQATAGPWYRTYYPKHDQNISKEEIDWLERLNRIGINYFRPLVTASFLGPDISPEQRGQLFKAIERFIFIVFRMSRSMANFGNSEFYRKARELRTGKTSVEEVIGRLDDLINRFFFYQSKSDGERYFKFGDFKNFLDRQFNDRGGFYAWNGLRYFLYEYEMEKALDSRHQKIDWEPFVKNEKDKVSIEHIYPQTPTDEAWKKSFGQYKEEEQVFFQGTLGNLLALSQSINSSLQNNSFAEKVQGYSNGSDSAIEVAKEYKEWNPDSIRKRGMMLLKFMEERWNLKFENEDAKEKLLFLDFMKKK